MNVGSMRWQAQFVLWGGFLLLMLSSLTTGRLSLVGRTIWNG